MARVYYYGGMRKKIFVPLSTPDRAVIEANQVRQGYSHLTWNTLNSYYLQKCVSKEQYLEIVSNCKKIAFDVYAQNRQENDYLKDDAQYKISVFVWAICFLAAILLFLEELDLMQFNEKNLLIVRWIIVGCLILNFLMSLVNYGTLPKDEIF